MADSYCHQLLKVAIAQICQGLGWHAIQTTPCDLLNDVLQRYIEHMAGSAHRYAEQYGRTEPSLDDVALAFSDMQVHLSEFEVYLRDVDPVPFVHSLPEFPVAKKTNLQHPRPGSRDCRERLWYIPAHMPPLVGVSRDLAEVVDPIEPGGQSISTGYPYSRDDDSASADTPYEYTPGHATPRGEKRELLNPYNEQTMKRLRLADDGTPQELTAVFMGVNGELTPKREGKLPEATTPPQRDWHRPSLPQSPLARKGSEGLTGDMPHRRTPDATCTPPLIRPPKSPKASAKPPPVSPKVKGPPPPKPKPKSPKHLMFSPHAPSKYQVKPKTPVGSTPVVDLAKPEQVPSPAPKSPKGGYLSILNTSKKPPESPKVVQEPPKTPILSSLMKKKESAKDTALKVYDFEDDFDFSSAPSKDRPHAAMDSFASSKVPSSKPLTEPKQEPSQYSTSESIDASIEAVVSGNITRNPLSLVQETGKSKKNKQSKEKSDKKEKSKEKHKDKHKDKEKSKDSKEKNREEKKQEEKKEATVVFGGSSPYSFEDSFSAAIKKRDDAQKSSKGHSLPPKIFLKNAWKEGEGAVTSSIRIGSEPGQAPKLVIKTENPAENPSEKEGKKQGDKGKDKTKLKMKKKEKLKMKKKKEKLMKKKLEKKKMLQSKAPSTDKSEGSSSNPKDEEVIPKMNIVSQGPAGLKIHLSSSPQVTPEHKGSTKEEKDKSKDKSKKKKKDKDKKQKKKEGKKDTKKSESKKEDKEKEKKEKKAKGDSAASSPAPGPPAIPKITLKLGAKPSGVEKSRQIVIKPAPTPVSPPSPKVAPSLSPPTSPVRKPAQKASPKPKSPKPKSPKPKSPATPKSPPTPKSPKSPPPPMLPIPVPPVRKASLAASKAVSAMSAPRAKGVSPPSAQKAAPEKRQGAAKATAASAAKAASSKAATSPKPAPVPTKAALAVGKGPPASPVAGKAAASTSKDKDDDVQRTVITETVGTVVSDTGEKIWICPACKLPDDGSPMVGCDDCDDWYHWPCVGLEDEPEEENWYCSKCIKAKKQAPKAKKKKKKHKD